jgi:hypothetical protein
VSNGNSLPERQHTALTHAALAYPPAVTNPKLPNTLTTNNQVRPVQGQCLHSHPYAHAARPASTITSQGSKHLRQRHCCTLLTLHVLQAGRFCTLYNVAQSADQSCSRTQSPLHWRQHSLLQQHESRIRLALAPLASISPAAFNSLQSPMTSQMPHQAVALASFASCASPNPAGLKGCRQQAAPVNTLHSPMTAHTLPQAVASFASFASPNPAGRSRIALPGATGTCRQQSRQQSRQQTAVSSRTLSCACAGTHVTQPCQMCVRQHTQHTDRPNQGVIIYQV